MEKIIGAWKLAKIQSVTFMHWSMSVYDMEVWVNGCKKT